MRTVRKLYLREYFLLLGLIVAGLAAIFSLIDLIGKIDDFSASRPSVLTLALYAAYGLPRFSLYLLPMAVLVCGLYIFSQAFRRREIIAVKAAGGSMRSLFMPFVVAGIGLAFLAFLIGVFIAPSFSSRAIELRNRLEGKGRQAAFKEGVIWLKAKDGSPVRIDLYSPEQKTAQGITIFTFGAEFLKDRISAGRAVWDGKAWLLQDVAVLDLSSGITKRSKELRYEGLDAPEVFASDLKTPDEMGLLELVRYMQRLRAAGFGNLKLSVDFHTKISFPLINIVMMLLGISLSVRGKTGSGFVSAGLGLAISLAYWLGYTFTLSLGYAGILPTVVAAWTVPLLFCGIALYLYIAMPE